MCPVFLLTPSSENISSLYVPRLPSSSLIRALISPLCAPSPFILPHPGTYFPVMCPVFLLIPSSGHIFSLYVPRLPSSSLIRAFIFLLCSPSPFIFPHPGTYFPFMCPVFLLIPSSGHIFSLYVPRLPSSSLIRALISLLCAPFPFIFPHPGIYLPFMCPVFLLSPFSGHIFSFMCPTFLLT
ncbi:hypothetical protein SAMD00020551_0880 [Mesobacillus selenatarsenatis SF-1]|uniref:Uncharacterized protein n=1 Tax=Mesobacillus selenatarsenatis (strain DSM 18680 / JCM 14380 / FERM P-15431 / SF-1) TaxID=1321606 RepID=A0A0A8WYF4_MESS1|nr:hypothetical protein SAMD00020551_0880 [Mesobacillus selenatarsenatis SF-1]